MLQFESLLLVFGYCCAGPTFLISGSDLCDSFPLVQGLAHLELAPLVVGLCSFEMLLSLQRSACSGFPLPSPSFSWSGSLVPAPGMGYLGAAFLPQAFTCLAVFISAWDRAFRLIGTLAKSRQAGTTVVGFWIAFRSCFAGL